MNELKSQLLKYEIYFGLKKKIPCSKADNKIYRNMKKNNQDLPTGVYEYCDENDNGIGDFYTLDEVIDLTKEETERLLLFKKLDYIRSIKNCSVFFTVLAVISLIASILVFFIH